MGLPHAYKTTHFNWVVYCFLAVGATHIAAICMLLRKKLLLHILKSYDRFCPEWACFNTLRNNMSIFIFSNLKTTTISLNSTLLTCLSHWVHAGALLLFCIACWLKVNKILPYQYIYILKFWNITTENHAHTCICQNCLCESQY